MPINLEKSSHRIRYATIEDKQKIMGFIRTYWSVNHVLGNSEDLFDYEFCPDGQSVNFVVAEKENEIHAILGFIDYGDHGGSRDIFTVMWMTRQDAGEAFLGLKLYMFLIKDPRNRYISSCGIRDSIRPLYRILKWKTATMDYLVMVNPNISSYHIACIENLSEYGKRTLINRPDSRKYSIKSITNEDDLFTLDNTGTKPFKSKDYIAHRYMRHIKYDYELFGLMEGSKMLLLLVMRKVKQEEASIYRIIDLIGRIDLISNFGSLFEGKLIDDIEYIDAYIGNNQKVVDALLSMGFNIPHSKDVFPNFFEPFEARNKTLKYMSSDLNAINLIVKGDGDQDRPNLL